MKQTKTVKIGGKEWKIRTTVRALFIWEQIAGRPFEIKTTLDNYLYFYALLLANNEDFWDWDTFISKIDDDPTAMVEIERSLIETSKISKLLDDNGEAGEDGKKKE